MDYYESFMFYYDKKRDCIFEMGTFYNEFNCSVGTYISNGHMSTEFSKEPHLVMKELLKVSKIIVLD